LKKLWIFVKERIPSYFFSLNYLAVACASPDNMLKFFWPLLTLNYYSQSFHILRQKMIISQVFLQQLQQQNTPHFIVYFSENQKNQKNTNKKVRRAKTDEWCFDHKTLYLERKKQKTKTIFWTVAAAPNYIMTSWKKKWLTNESFSKSFFFESL